MMDREALLGVLRSGRDVTGVPTYLKGGRPITESEAQMLRQYVNLLRMPQAQDEAP
jgi:hypothetical protein